MITKVNCIISLNGSPFTDMIQSLADDCNDSDDYIRVVVCIGSDHNDEEDDYVIDDNDADVAVVDENWGLCCVHFGSSFTSSTV